MRSSVHWWFCLVRNDWQVGQSISRSSKPPHRSKQINNSAPFNCGNPAKWNGDSSQRVKGFQDPDYHLLILGLPFPTARYIFLSQERHCSSAVSPCGMGAVNHVKCQNVPHSTYLTPLPRRQPAHSPTANKVSREKRTSRMLWKISNGRPTEQSREEERRRQFE